MTLTDLRTLDPTNLDALSEQGLSAVDAVRRAGGDHVAEAAAALRWAAATFGDSLVLMSSMGDEALVHLASVAAPGIQVAFIDTGYHFAETLGTADTYEATRPIRMLRLTPVLSVAQQDQQYGPALHERDPDRCCAMRKVEPLERALAGHAAWVTGMRRADAPTRRDIDLVGVDARRQMLKINPLARWTDEQLDAYVEDNGVLLNPLRQAGYPSIGCAPCTRPVAAGEDPRAGRWSGTQKTECGLHV